MTTAISSNSTIDVNGIVSALMAVEQQPLQRLERSAQGLNSTISEFGRLQNSMDALQSAAQELTNLNTWRASSASSSDDTAVEISASEGALQGNFAIKVNQLASSQTVVSQALESGESVIGGGTLSIQLGSNDGGFTADPEREALNLTLEAGATLADISAAINSADAGVGASLVTDAEGTRLMIRSTDSGKTQAFEISGTTDGTAEGLSLADLSYVPGQAAGTVQATEQAANAQFELNGLALESESNQPQGVLENVSLTLRRITTDPVDVSVISDAESIRAKLDGFVTAYNDMNSLIRTQTGYNSETQSSGPLQGNRMVILSQSRMRDVITGTLDGSNGETPGLSRLADIGIEFERDGSLSLNESKFEVASANTSAMSELFAGRGTDGASDGFGRQLDDALSNLLGTDGAITGATETLRLRERAIEDQQERFERRLESIESRLIRQYTTLDANLAVLQSSLNQVSQLG